MIEKLPHTDADYACTFLRTIAGIIIFPYGMQKLLGWFGGVGIDARVIKWLWSNAIKTKFRCGVGVLRIEPRGEKVGEMVAIPWQICTKAVFERAATWVLCEARL